MCFSRKKETYVCILLILHYIGQDQEQGGHWFGTIKCSFVIVKTEYYGHR
jgi:hypothetical protein